MKLAFIALCRKAHSGTIGDFVKQKKAAMDEGILHDALFT